MNQKVIIGILVAIILVGGGAFAYFSGVKKGSQSGAGSGKEDSQPVVECTAAAGETAFKGKVAYDQLYRQYTLEGTDGTTYYLRTQKSGQLSSLKDKVGKDAQVNGTLATPGTSDVNVATVCP